MKEIIEKINELVTLKVLPSYLQNIVKNSPLLLSDALNVQKTNYQLYGENKPHIIKKMEETIKQTKKIIKIKKRDYSYSMV